jgi:hypothetical protein
LLFANRRRTHQLVAALPYPKQQHTRTHIARVACAGISAVHVGASRRHVGFIFCPPSFRLLLATSGCCCCFGWGVVVRCSCHVKRRPLNRTS